MNPFQALLKIATSIFSAEVHAGSVRKQIKQAIADQAAFVRERAQSLSFVQGELESQYISDYEKQLQGERNLQQLKAFGIAAGMILIAVLMLYFLSKTFKK